MSKRRVRALGPERSLGLAEALWCSYPCKLINNESQQQMIALAAVGRRKTFGRNTDVEGKVDPDVADLLHVSRPEKAPSVSFRP
jgi:hypothetical protein